MSKTIATPSSTPSIYASQEVQKSTTFFTDKQISELLFSEHKECFDSCEVVIKLRAIRGLDTPEAWALRDQYVEQYPARVLDSLTGLDTPKAWDLRDQYVDQYPGSVLQSLMGLDSERAWDLRDTYGSRDLDCLLISLVGLDTPKAWALRDEYKEFRTDLVIKSLVGLDSDRAWALRDKYKGTHIEAVLISLIGLYSQRAWALRNSDIKPSVGLSAKNIRELIISSVAGLNSQAAKSFRAKLTGKDLIESINESAWRSVLKLQEA